MVNPKYADISLKGNSNIPKCAHHFVNIIDSPDFHNFIKGRASREISEYKNSKKTKFCAFMYSNGKAKARSIFCEKLMAYKKVDCLGLVMRNTEIVTARTSWASNWLEEQFYIYKDYKFNIAFENTSAKGYFTEKIIQPLHVGSVPIYWGASDIHDYINPECFINVNDFDSFDDCIEYVKKVDGDPELYQKYRDAVPILPDSKIHDVSEDKLALWMKDALADVMKSKTRVGKIGCIGKLKYRIWLFLAIKIRREKQKYLHNVKMPILEKIKWIVK